MSESVPKKRIMRAKEVEELVGFSRTTLWRRIRDKQFPGSPPARRVEQPRGRLARRGDRPMDSRSATEFARLNAETF